MSRSKIAAMRRAVGYDVQVKALKGSVSGYTWTTKQFGKVIGEGSETTETGAYDRAWECVRAAHEKTQERTKAKAAYLAELRAMVKARPYMVAGVCEMLIYTRNCTLDMVRENAEAQEKAWWRKDPIEFRRDIPTHHRALSPMQAAQKIFYAALHAGMVEAEYGEKGPEDSPVVTSAKRLKTWANDKLGEIFP